jgi:hypothetical protein
MEKYRKFTDAATGINPFVPHPAPSAARKLFALVLAPFHGAFLLAFALLLAAVDGALLAANAAGLDFANAALSPLTWFLSHAMVLLISCSNTRASAFPPKASTLAGRAVPDGVRAPAAGDVVFANHQTPLDVLVLQRAFPARRLMFAFPQPGGAACVLTTSKLAAMQQVLAPAAAGAGALNLVQAQRRAKEQGCVLVSFPEGVTTNGGGMLRLPNIECLGAVHLAAVTYSNPSAAMSVLPTRSVVMWMLSTLSRLAHVRVNHVDVAVVRPSGVPPVAAAGSAEFSEAVQAKIGAAASYHRFVDKQCRPLALTAADKVRFLEQWAQYN